MSCQRKLLLPILVPMLALCACSFIPMTVRYLNEERSAFSYMTPTEIITLLENELSIRDAMSFDELQATLLEYGVTCRQTADICAQCKTPVASTSPFEYDPMSWWELNTFTWKHEIDIALRPVEGRRISIQTYNRDGGSFWWQRWDYNTHCGPDILGDRTEVNDSFPSR